MLVFNSGLVIIKIRVHDYQMDELFGQIGVVLRRNDYDGSSFFKYIFLHIAKKFRGI